MNNENTVIKRLNPETTGVLLSKALWYLIKNHSHAVWTLFNANSEEENIKKIEVTSVDFMDIASNAAYLNLGYANIPECSEGEMDLNVWFNMEYFPIYRYKASGEAYVNVTLCEQVLNTLCAQNSEMMEAA